MKFKDILDTVNIAEALDDQDLYEIGHKVTYGYERDLESREEWDRRNADALKLALQVRESKSFPWPGAANVHYPLVTVACMQFNARAFPALLPNTGLVKHKVIGADPDGKKTARARRVSEHMNYNLCKDDRFEDGMDRLLMTVPLLGCSFQKTYFDGEENISEHVTPENFVVDYWTKTLADARRKTHVLFKSKNDIISKQRMEVWREFDIDTQPEPDQSEMEEARNAAQGTAPPHDDFDAPYKILEQHCWLDLDDDGYEEPYIVTVLEHNSEVLRIVKGFQPEGVTFGRKGKVAKIVQDQYFTKFGFIPSPDGGFYDVGFGILLAPINESVNTIINQLIDAGTLSNLQSGFISKNVRIEDGRSIFTPGEWKSVNAFGDDIRKGIVPLPVREPSQTLMALLGVLIEAGQKIGSVSESMMGENPGQNQPAQTTMAVLEQGMKVYSAIIKRQHRSLTNIFRRIYSLNQLFMEPEEYFEVLDPATLENEDAGTVYAHDYEGDPTAIIPVSDPNIISDTQRLAKAEAVLIRAQTNPAMYNMHEAERRYLEALQEVGIDSVLKPQDQIQPQTDPEIELKKAELEHKIQKENVELELRSQEAIINAKKKIADTERSLVNAGNIQERQQLEVAKFLDESELKRLELLAEIAAAKREVDNVKSEGSE